jgi:cell wall assembly regulator SMI1
LQTDRRSLTRIVIDYADRVEVQESWAEIVAWCRQYAPNTANAIRAPANPAVLREVQASTIDEWPEDLHVWYTLMDGTQRSPAGYVLPGYCPMPLDAVRSQWSRWRKSLEAIAASPPDEASERRLHALGGVPERTVDAIARVESEPAGSVASVFLSSFIPIAEDQSGSDMFVDTRTGPLYGCVTEFFKGNADFAGPVWSSVSAMLADVADGLRAGRPLKGRQPVVSDHQLHWEVILPT